MKKNILREYIREAFLFHEAYINHQTALKLQQQHDFLKNTDIKTIMWMTPDIIKQKEEEYENRKQRAQNPQEAQRQDREKQRSKSLFYAADENPTLATGRRLHSIRTTGGKDLPSIIKVFDEIEDRIKSSNPESIKMITLDTPKQDVKSALIGAKHKLNIFANSLKNSDLKTSFELNNLTDSIFDNLTK